MAEYSAHGRNLYVGLFLGAVVGFALSRLLSTATHTLDGRVLRPAQHPGAFFLGVTITFSSPEDKAHFKELFRPLAQYVQDFEPDTLSYILSESDKDPLRVSILERYRDKNQAFLETHRSSPAFVAFKSKMGAMVEAKKITLVDGHSYLEQAGLGFA